MTFQAAILSSHGDHCHSDHIAPGKKTSKRGKKSDKIRFAVKHLALTGHPVCDHIVEMKC